MTPKVGDIIRLIPESWPAPGFDAGYMGNVCIDGELIGPGNTSLIEKVLPPRWFMHKVMEITDVRELPGSTLYIVERTVTITLKLRLLEREFEVIDECEEDREV